MITHLLLEIVDLGFYNNFGTHFNVTVFDFFHEGPTTLIQVIWEEYPVIWLTLLPISVFLLLLKLRISFPTCKTLHRNYWVMAILLVALVISMRGSISQFPLQVEDLRVSHIQKINDLVPNPCYLLKKAIKEKKHSFELLTDEEILGRYEFSSEEEAFEELGLTGKSLFATATRTDSSLSKPNIVIMLSESWSGYLTNNSLETDNTLLLCGMQRHLREDLLMLNYQSVQNGTIASIEDLVISTPFPRVFRSAYRYLPFSTSMAIPFNQSGYKTIFMSGMDQEWENIGESLRIQGFDSIIDRFAISKNHPEYKGNSVGLFDHYLMKAIMEELGTDKGHPKLILVMTTTNHPPFVYPHDIKLPEIPDSFYDNPQWGNKKEVQEKYIHGYQYANYAMASFLNELKESTYADNTIVVITGDHNVRTALAYSDDGVHVPTRWEYSVPLYIYLPPSIRNVVEKEGRVNLEKWGDHHDIIPTLAKYAFSDGVSYLNIGKDLLNPELNEMNTASINTSKTLSDIGFTREAKRKAKARECLLLLYHTRFLRNNSNKD